MSVTSQLTQEKALIFRITHRDNIAWILDHGLHSATSPTQDPAFVTIGLDEVIGKRSQRETPDPPGGTLADYVPFYFTPLSPMLYMVKTGYHGVVRRPMEEIVIIVASIFDLIDHKQTFFFTDRHAIYNTARYFTSIDDLDHVPWNLLRSGVFKRDPEHPDRFERFQAETLVHQHLPVAALKGLVCYNEDVKIMVDTELEHRKLNLPVKVYPGWFF